MMLSRSIQILGYAGLIPFLVPIYFVMNAASLAGLSPTRIFIAYSAVILTFLCGAIWSQVVSMSQHKLVKERPPEFQEYAKNRSEIYPTILAIMTNLLAISAWVLMLITDNYPVLALFSLLVGYVVVLWMELGLKLHIGHQTKSTYLSLRWRLTLVVCIAHIAMLTLHQ